ncbi:MAG: segregation/condensation protein A [Acidobacteriota bacterium]|jgi:segregation and condensation protein A|nr:segregation/condensation protein A [Acidobacteriota bacterium]OQB56126.1 MAG: Segregation and condensation protein A [Candidatus Aminicenantes bacterium ADurb.Bin147]HNQ80609.1 segregation/condensation protein A [Candidatus Aminicenantes bacterium]MDD8010988.1 segregation/condensation protein A [Acidobacteriota bacterium]MDD8029535.1 segregation/condensation protein A [Acidobacteriota bacterium]
MVDPGYPNEEGPLEKPAPEEESAVEGGGDGYQIKLDIFEGPLDLLLFLIKKKKIGIEDIPLAVITREYLDYLHGRERINLDREAEFLLMAALLIYIKSQILLPREQPVEPDIDPRKERPDRTEDYERVKVVSAVLRDKEEEQSTIWRRTALNVPLPEEDLDLIEVSLFDLAESFFAMMKRKQAVPQRILKTKEISVADKIREIVSALREHGFLDFLEYLDAQETLEEALVAFFCLLELIKARRVVAVQEQLFHTIKVWLRKEPAGEDA